jgi:amino-acid N-acetyltransferase
MKIIRECLKYFPEHQDAIFIIKLEGELIEDGYLVNLVPDIVLLRQQGIKQVFIHGINAQLRKLIQPETETYLLDMFNAVRATDLKTLAIVKEACMRVNWEISTVLSSGAHTGAEIKTITGHVIKVRKIVRESGVDFQFTVDVNTLQTMLDAHLVPIISPLGIDEMGNILSLNADFLAAKVATSLGADKLIFLTSSDGIFDQNHELVREKTPSEMRNMLNQGLITGDMAFKVEVGLDACENGVPRIHFVNGKRDGSLLLELFSIDGSGSMIYGDKDEDMG